MADTKKNTAKKGTKKEHTKASGNKTEAHKKSSATKNTAHKTHADHSSTKKSAQSKSTQTKKGTHDTKSTPETQPKKHVSEREKEPNNTWMVVSIILGILIVLLVISIGIVYTNQGDNATQDNNNNNNNENEQVDLTNDNDKTKLLIIEDPECANCQVDLFASQVKENLVPDLEYEKINYESSQAQEIISQLDVNQVPVYLFSSNFDQRDDWEELKGAFIPINVSGSEFYMLNPQFIPNKIMIEEPEITESAVIIGDENAPVTIMEFTDFECPFCAIAEGNDKLVAEFTSGNRTYTPPIPKIMEEYVESGEVKIVFYNMPIAQLHPKSRTAHLAALCANEQNKFEEYSRILWDDRSNWTSLSDRVPKYKEYAKDLDLDTSQFNECLDNRKYDSQIDQEQALAREYGVSGTPAFFVGRTFISGAQDFSVFKNLIEAELEE